MNEDQKKQLLNQIVKDATKYTNKMLGASGHDNYKAARAGQLACFWIFSQDQLDSDGKPVLNTGAKLTLAKIVASTIDRTNTGWLRRSKLREYLNPNGETLKTNAAIDPEFNALADIANINKGSPTLLAVVAVLNNILRTSELTPKEKKAAIDAWVKTIDTLTSDKSYAGELGPVLARVKKYASEITDKTAQVCRSAQRSGIQYPEHVKRLLADCQAHMKDLKASVEKLDRFKDYFGVKTRISVNCERMRAGLKALEERLKGVELMDLNAEENTLKTLVAGARSGLTVIRGGINSLEMLTEGLTQTLTERVQVRLVEIKKLMSKEISQNNGYRRQRLETLETRLRTISDTCLTSIFTNDTAFNSDDFIAINGKVSELNKTFSDCAAQIDAIKKYDELALGVPKKILDIEEELETVEFKDLPDYHGFKAVFPKMLDEIKNNNRDLSQGIRPANNRGDEPVDFFKAVAGLEEELKTLNDGIDVVKSSAELSKEIKVENQELSFLLKDEEAGVVHTTQGPKVSGPRKADLDKVSKNVVESRTDIEQMVVSGPAVGKTRISREEVTAAQQKNLAIRAKLEEAREIMQEVKSADGYLAKIRKGMEAMAKRLKALFSSDETKSAPKATLSGSVSTPVLVARSKVENYSKDEKHYDIGESKWMHEELVDLVVSEPLYRRPGCGDVETAKESYKVHARYLVREELENMKADVDVLLELKKAGDEKRADMLKVMDKLNEKRKELENIFVAIRDNFDFSKSGNKDIVDYSRHFSPLLTQFEDEFAVIKKQAFGFEPQPKKMSDEEKVYYHKAVQLSLPRFTLDQVKNLFVSSGLSLASSPRDKEIYQASAYFYLYRQISLMSQLAEEIEFIKSKIKIKGSTLSVEELEELNKKNIELENIYKRLSNNILDVKQHSKILDPKFLIVITQFETKFGKFAVFAFYEIFSVQVAKLDLPNRYPLTDVEKRRQLFQIVQSSPLTISKEDYQAHVFYLLREVLQEVSAKAQDILKHEETLRLKGQFLTLRDSEELEKQIKLLGVDRGNFQDLLKLVNQRKDLLPHSLLFRASLDRFSQEFELFNQQAYGVVVSKKRNLEDFVKDLERHKFELAKNVRDLTIEHPYRSEEVVEEITGRNPELTVIMQQATDQFQPIPGMPKPQPEKEQAPPASAPVSPKVEAAPQEQEGPRKRKLYTSEEAHQFLIKKDQESEAKAKAYDLCLMLEENIKPERGNLYLKKINGMIAYTVITPDGKTVRDIPTNIEAPESFDLINLKPLKNNILERTSKAGHTYKSTSKVASHAAIQDTLKDIFSALEKRNCEKVIAFGPSTEAMRRRFKKGDEFVVSPKAFVYTEKSDYEEDFKKDTLSVDTTCLEEVQNLDKASHLLLAAVRMAAVKDRDFLIEHKDLKDETVVWVATNMTKTIFSMKLLRSEKEQKLIDKITKDLEKRKEALGKFVTKMEVTNLVGRVIFGMLYPEAQAPEESVNIWDLVKEFFRSKRNSDTAEVRGIITNFCGDFLKIVPIGDDEEKIVMESGIGAHRIMEWLNDALTWANPERGISQKEMLKFSKLLNKERDKIIAKESRFPSEEAQAEYLDQSGDLRVLNQSIREDLTTLFRETEALKANLEEVVKLICSTDKVAEEHKQAWKKALEKADFKEENFEKCAHNSSSTQLLVFFNMALDDLYRDGDESVRGILSRKQADFVRYAAERAKSIHGKSLVDFISRGEDSPPQLSFKDPMDKEHAASLQADHEAYKAKKAKKAASPPSEVKQINIGELPEMKVKKQLSNQQLQVQRKELMSEEQLRDIEIKAQIQNQQVHEIARDFEEVAQLVLRCNVLVSSQGSGHAGYDMMLLTVREDEKDIISRAKEASQQYGRRHPVIIRQGKELHVYGKSYQKKWDGDSLYLTAFDPSKKFAVDLSGMEDKRVPIINKWKGEFSLLKFDGRSWEVRKLKTESWFKEKEKEFPTDPKKMTYMPSCAVDEKGLIIESEWYRFVDAQKELFKKGANKEWRLTKIGSYSDSHALIQGLPFPTEEKGAELLEGSSLYQVQRLKAGEKPAKPGQRFKVVPTSEIYDKIAKVKGHKAGAMNDVLKNILHGKQQVADGLQAQEETELLQIDGEVMEKRLKVMQDQVGQLKSAAAALGVGVSLVM